MATKADFSEDEWKALQKGVTGAGMLVSVSERGFTDSFGEASAIAKYLAGQHERSDSALVRDVANVRRTGFGVTASTQEVEAETVEALRSALETLRAKAPDEEAAYRDLVLGVADHVAAAKGGLAPAEAAAIEKLRQALDSV